jgi:hypothetical protein
MNEPMSAERRAEIRAAWADGGALNRTGREVRDLLAELDRVTAERDEASNRSGRAVEGARQAMEEQTGQKLRATSRADRAEAALARVTDDSMAEKIARAIYEHSETDERGAVCLGCGFRPKGDLAAHQATHVLAVFRAAAEGQDEQGGERDAHS